MKKFEQKWEDLLEALHAKRFWGTRLDNFLIKFFYGVALLIIIILLLPSERPFEYSNLTVGSIAPEEIIAPFKFGIQKTEQELEREREQARQNVPPVFDKNLETENVQQITLNNFFTELNSFFKQFNFHSANQQTKAVKDSLIQVGDSLLQRFALNYDLDLSYTNLIQLDSLHQYKKLFQFTKYFNQGLSRVYQQGILDRPKKEIVEDEIVIIESGIEESMPVSDVLEMKEAETQIKELLNNHYSKKAIELDIADHLISSFLTPNLKFNESITNTRKEKAAHDVSLVKGYVKQNERIIDSHEIVTESVYQKLQSLSRALRERSDYKENWQQVKFYLGKIFFAATLLLLTVLYLYFYRKETFDNNQLLGMVTLIFLLQLGAAAIITEITDWANLAIPIILAPMLLSMLLDFGIAFIGTVTLSLILGAILGNDYTLTFMTLIVGSIAVFSVQKIRNRGQMFRAILYILLGYLGVQLIFGLFHFESMKEILKDFGVYLLPNAILIPTVVFLMIGLFERLFDVTTDITLLELSDLNHPLLKQLSVRAPGSFHHSIVVANLAEAAALAVPRTNALLTRVGCYFHDVGKMLKPEYFVENQMSGVNKHDNLTPRMSSLILVNHVKSGYELAEKYNLPKAVKQFIPEHHGTSLITYFYRKALENKNATDIEESNFRYPGPMPQSKETGIAMLADTVEAASRTLQNPTPQRIRNLVDSLVDKKIEEGQLDNCDLTLKHINDIKNAFIPILTGIHHVRIEYPGEPSEKEKKPTNEKTSLRVKSTAGKTPHPTGQKKQRVEASSKSSHADSN